MIRLFVLFGLLGLSLWIGITTGPAAAQTRGPAGRGGRPGETARPSGGDESGGIRPYDDVITDKAVSKPGLFLTHRIDDKLFYEIPVSKLNKDMLWVVQIAQTQAGFSYAGMPVGDRVVKWELRDEKVLLRDVKYSIRADVKDSIKRAVEATSVSSIIRVFPVRAWGKDKAPVIEVTGLFTSDVSEFSARRSLNASSLDTSKTFLEETKAFPQNLETKVLATYNLASDSPTGPRPGGESANRDPTQSSVTALIHHSMLLLPEQKMKPRVYDRRVGFFTVGFEDYGDFEAHQVENVRFVTRWRLEKKEPDAELSEPVTPIVFYVGREVPDVWKPYVKKGIEAWQPAFEKAGFKNAIQGKLAPSVHEDPNWDAEDSRISTIRWLPSTTENAFGPHVHDPRTGEILEADVRMYHNVMKLARDWYFVQASPNDPRAQQLPLPDEVMGELLAYIVAHEVGHSLGFPHNMKASSAYTIENLRNPDFTKKFGVEASIMDYGRFNYVAQPGDNASLIPVVGPYDHFAVEWGYRAYKSDEDEKKGQAALLKKQLTDRHLLFGDAEPSEDPTRQTEDLGGDPVEATRLGLLNLDRVADNLVKACSKPNEDYDLLENMHQQLLSQRTRELVHVTSVVGGFEQKNFYFGDAEQVYHPLPTDRQKKAVEFLVQHALETPAKIVAPQITLRLEASGVAERILSSQQSVLRALLSDARLKRMAEHAQRQADAYTPLQLLEDLRKGVWRELDADEVKIDLYRRNLQRAYVDLLAAKLRSEDNASDVPALARAELKSLADRLASDQLKAKAKDPVVAAHLSQLKSAIEDAFEPAAPAAPSAPTTTTPTRRR